MVSLLFFFVGPFRCVPLTGASLFSFFKTKYISPQTNKQKNTTPFSISGPLLILPFPFFLPEKTSPDFTVFPHPTSEEEVSFLRG